MGKAQKQKGSRRELEFAKLIDGTKVPLSGAIGGIYSGDVKGLGLTFECKARKDGFKQMYTWLEKVDALALKADRKDWLIVMRLPKFLEGWKYEEGDNY